MMIKVCPHMIKSDYLYTVFYNRLTHLQTSTIISYKHGRCNVTINRIAIIHTQDYICVKEKGAVFLPHTAGRYAKRRFRKAQVSNTHCNTSWYDDTPLPSLPSSVRL